MGDGPKITAERIQNEVAKIANMNSGDISFLRDDTNTRHFVATVSGPAGTPYEGGQFKIDINLPDGFPINPPHVRFITKIWHPNISSQDGAIRSTLFGNDWSPNTGLESAMVSVQALLSAPQYYAASSSFNRKARKWTQKYATADPPLDGTTSTSKKRPLTKAPAYFKNYLP